MVRRSIFAGLMIFTLSSASDALLAQTPAQNQVAKPATGATTPSTTPKHHKHKKKAQAAPVEPAPPPPPPTPEESAAAAPVVSFENGKLTIRSENSTLGSILSAVKSRLGATVDGPGANSSERIATQLGPGDPRDVLSSLFANSKYNYILLGAPGNPTSVQKIILTARASGPGGAAPLNNGAPIQTPNQTGPPQGLMPPTPDQELPDAEIPDEANQPDAEPPQPEPPQLEQQPTPQPGIQPPNGQSTGDQSQNPNQPKTPEQLLQELQRMQQQQQQQQQQNPQ